MARAECLPAEMHTMAISRSLVRQIVPILCTLRDPKIATKPLRDAILALLSPHTVQIDRKDGSNRQSSAGSRHRDAEGLAIADEALSAPSGHGHPLRLPGARPAMRAFPKHSRD